LFKIVELCIEKKQKKKKKGKGSGPPGVALMSG
jgi:hypothetical protein